MHSILIRVNCPFLLHRQEAMQQKSDEPRIDVFEIKGLRNVFEVYGQPEKY